MKNDPIRIQSTEHECSFSDSGRGPQWMDGSQLRLQTSTTDETYSDGYVDYVHEI